LATQTIEAPPTTESDDAMTATGSNARHLPVGASITRGALALLSTQPVTWAGSLLTTIVAPRLLGAEGLGQYTIAFTIATLAATATGLGVSEFLVLRAAQSPATIRHDAGVALLVQTITTFLGALIILVLAPLGAFSVVDTRLLYIALPIMLITPAQTVLLSSFRGREMHGHYAWFNAASVVTGQVVGALALFAGGGVLIYTAIVGAVTVATTLITWKLSGLRPTFPAWGRSILGESRRFILGGLPFFTWQIVLAVTGQFDRVLLGWFVPAAEVGWYAAAYRIFAIPVFMPTLIINPLFPALSRSAHAPDTIRRTLTKTMRIVMLMMVPMTAGIVVVAPAIPSVLGWPADFSAATPMMIILSLQLPIIAVDMVYGVALMSLGRQRQWAYVGVAAAAVKFGLDLVVIPLFESRFGSGAVGASIVSLVTELVMFGGAVTLIPKHLLDPRVAWDATRIVMAGVATILVGGFLLPFALALAIVGGAVAFLAVAIALRALQLEDVRPLLAHVRSRLPRHTAQVS
jgi:O-antigen/teichoic acid export membrane protein